MVIETRIGAQRAGLLLATILCHGCIPPDPAATTTSAVLPRHVATAPRPVQATQIVEANERRRALQAGDALHRNVESCLTSESDADHDAIDDSEDQCPDTTPGVIVDATGCAVPGSILTV